MTVSSESAFKTLSLPTHSDPRGSLTVIENLLPFQVRRLYWIYGATDDKRGGHRHRKTRQAAVALTGTVRFYMDNGKSRETIELDAPDTCLLIEPEDWHEMTFSDNAILLVLASEPYDKADYVSEPYEQ